MGTRPLDNEFDEVVVAKFLDEIFEASAPRLKHLAWENINEFNLNPDEYMMFCIQACNEWANLIEKVMPDYPWPEPEYGHTEIVRGLIQKEFGVIIAKLLPGLEDEFHSPTTPGHIKVVVLTEVGVGIYELIPQAAANLLN